MRAEKLTTKHVQDFSEYLLREAKLKAVRKESRWEMWVTAKYLDAMDIMDAKEFMEDYSVCWFGRAYFPFTIGDPTTFSLLHQVIIITHECQHGIQASRSGWRHYTRYAFSSAKRANIEADAYRSNLEMYYWFTGKIIDPGKLANVLKNYACTQGDIEVTKKSLEAAADLVRHGASVTAASILAIDWFKKNL